jgi:type VI secretion system secreted protein Hcp
LKSAEIKWYRVDDSGREVEYFNMMLGNVKVVSVIPKVSNIKEDAALAYNHVEQVKLRYEEITWSYLDGNLQYANHRRACCGKQKDSKHSLPLFMSPR